VLLLPGTQVTLRFSLSDAASPMTIQGTILNDDVHSKPMDVASGPAVDVKFTSLSPADQSRIKAWVRQQAPKSSDLS
jgi:hypothetical protein